MARSSFSAPVCARKSRAHPAPDFSPISSKSAEKASPLPPSVLSLRARGVSPDDLVAVMTALDEFGGVREIGDLAGAIPDCTRPISAILALADAGLLAIDCEAPFDASTQVTRVG